LHAFGQRETGARRDAATAQGQLLLRRACRSAGFKFVALDLGGLQSGSLSLPLAAT